MAKKPREERQGGVLEKTRPKTDKPKQWKVLIHNDDYSTMDFVVDVLESVFNLSPAESYRVMMKVHQEGVGVAGIFAYEVAETKVAQVHERAKVEGHPLRASMEEE